MIVRYNNEDLELRYSLRIYIIYENIMETSDIKEDYTTLLTLLYSTLVATLQYHRKKIDMDYQDFLDWVDDNGGIKLVTDFSTWFSKQAAIQMDMVNIDPNDKQEDLKKN